MGRGLRGSRSLLGTARCVGLALTPAQEAGLCKITSVLPEVLALRLWAEGRKPASLHLYLRVSHLSEAAVRKEWPAEFWNSAAAARRAVHRPPFKEGLYIPRM